MPDSDFIRDMARFQGEISANIKNICKDIKEIKQERIEHSTKFWEKFDGLDKKVNRIETELSVIKGKAGMIALIISIAIGVGGLLIKYL